MAKKSDSPESKIAEAIAANPTASDAQIAVLAGVKNMADLVSTVRGNMGAKHEWPKPKEEK